MADEIVGSAGPIESSGEIIGGQQTESAPGEIVEGEQVLPEPLDPQLVSRASIWNLNEQDLRAVPRDTIERMLNGADRAMLDAHRRAQASFTPNPAQTQPQQFQQSNQQQTPTGFTPAPYDLKFDSEEEDADSPVAKKMAGINAHYAKQMEAMRDYYNGKMGGVEQFMTSMRTQQYHTAVDRAVQGWGPEWANVFGKTPMSELDPRSQEFLRFDEVGMAAFELQQAHARMTGRPLADSEALRRARDLLHPGKAFEFERAKENAKRTELRAGSSDRPRSGTAPNPSNNGIRSRAQEMVRMMQR